MSGIRLPVRRASGTPCILKSDHTPVGLELIFFGLGLAVSEVSGSLRPGLGGLDYIAACPYPLA